jgi:glycosyltransferase involved in cell wall biosynthesis
MRILHVLHDFLPRHIAGVEVYTDQLVRGMAFEHDLALLYAEAAPEAPDHELRRGWHHGVRTYEVINNHLFRRFEETYSQPAIEARMREVLDEFRPDIVHVKHILNLSVGLVAELRRRGIPVIMTLHDHWLACANGGQRFHQELGRCESLDANRCAGCTVHMNGRARTRRGLLHRLSTPPGSTSMLALTDLRPRVHTPNPSFVYQDALSYGAGRQAWVAHPPARLEFQLSGRAGDRLTSEVAMHPDTFESGGGAVRFQVWVDGEMRSEHTLDPKRKPEDRYPRRVEAELGPGRHRVELVTEAEPPERNDYCTAAWVEPRVISAGGPHGRLERAAHGLARPLSALRDSSQARRIERRWEVMRRLAGAVDLFLAPSRYLAEQLTEFGLPAERVVHCDYGFVTEAFAKRDLPDQARRFAFLGSLVPHKGAHVLLDAFTDMPHDATLEICGAPYDPAYANELRRITRHPGVQLRGGLDPEHVPEFLHSVDCLVVPSIWQENSPLTIHEAFMAGVPVVASRMGGHVELLAEGGGLLYEADDASALHVLLRRLCDERGLARSLTASAPPVKSMPDHVAELLSFYGKLLAGREVESVSA